MPSSINNGAPFEDVWVSASAPATSANLGCAFDCAAIALNLRQHARASLRASNGFLVKYTGPDSTRVPCDASNLLVQCIQRFASARGAEIAGAAVEIESEIPVGVGLGSSAAATICGLLLGAALLGVEADRDEILSLAVKIEGHPDNVAAAYLGGLTVAFLEERSSRVLFAKTLVPANLRIIAIVPDIPLATHSARAALPASYSRADAVYNLQRTALLVAACFSGSFILEPELFRDRLHQPYRSRLIPGLEACLDVRHPSLLGVFLSGAGSSVLALVRENEKEVADLLAQGFQRYGVSTKTLFLQAENHGVMDFVREGAGRA